MIQSVLLAAVTAATAKHGTYYCCNLMASTIAMLPICLIGRLIAIPADARHVKTMIRSEPAGIVHPIPHFSAIKNQKLKHQFIQRQSQNTACHAAENRIGERLRRNHPAELIRAHANGPHNAILLCPGRCAGIHAVENIEYRNESNGDQETINKNRSRIIDAL